MRPNLYASDPYAFHASRPRSRKARAQGAKRAQCERIDLWEIKVASGLPEGTARRPGLGQRTAPVRGAIFRAAPSWPTGRGPPCRIRCARNDNKGLGAIFCNFRKRYLCFYSQCRLLPVTRRKGPGCGQARLPPTRKGGRHFRARIEAFQSLAAPFAAGLTVWPRKRRLGLGAGSSPASATRGRHFRARFEPFQSLAAPFAGERKAAREALAGFAQARRGAASRPCAIVRLRRTRECGRARVGF